MTIRDDTIPENSEFFNADVNARPEDASIVVIGSPKQPLIEIQDLMDGECCSTSMYVNNMLFHLSVCTFKSIHVHELLVRK